MGLFGRLKKVFGKIKNAGKKVWGGIKNVVQKLLPVMKIVGPQIANAIAPGSGAVVSKVLTVADLAAKGDYSGALQGAQNISWKD